MMIKNSSSDCEICGAKLEYLNNAEAISCAYCGASGEGRSRCPAGHFMCDACSGRDAMVLIETVAFSASTGDPVALAELMMSHPNIPMLGCEHALIAAGALMAALKNSPYGKGKIGDQEIRESLERAGKQVVDGSCALTGVCGIAPAIGACFSIFLGVHRGSDREQRITMEAVSRVSQTLAGMTGPSCCKAYVRASLMEAVAIFGERFGIALPVGNNKIICRHSEKHPHGCREAKCPYFEKPAKDIFAEMKFVPGTVCTT